MREILFRGKRVDNGEIVEGFYIFDGFDNYIVKFYTDENAEGTLYPIQEAFEVIPETLGQFTGQTDKNGKKVFEGDIVKIKDFSVGCYLTCEQPTSNFAVKWYGKEGRFGIDYMKFFPYDFTKSEVIGNIHDNPELLKKGGT